MTDRSRETDLYTYPRAKVFDVQLVTLDGKPKPIRHDEAEPPNLHPPLPDTTSISVHTPRFPWSSIEVIEKLERDWVLKVSLDGQVMCCKLSTRATHESLSREYSALQQILDADCTPMPRKPSLKGVVESTVGKVVGILMEYVNKMLPTLADILSATDSAEGFWKAKWGDAKTSNILIDEKDDVWIADVGGGLTLGWEDYKLMGTQEGELSALKKIHEAMDAEGRTKHVDGDTWLKWPALGGTSLRPECPRWNTKT